MNLIQFVRLHPLMTMAIGGIPVVVFKDTILEMLSLILDLFRVKKYMFDYYTGSIIIDYLNENFRGFGVSDEVYEAKWEHVRPLSEEYNVWYRAKNSSARLWFYKGIPLLLWPGHKMNDHSPNDGGQAAFMFLRWTLNWKKLIKEAGDHRDNKVHRSKLNKENKFKVIRHRGSTFPPPPDDGTPEVAKGYQYNEYGEPIFWKYDDIGNPRPTDPMRYLSITKSMQKVIDRVKFWFNDKDWYKERDIIWKLGILLYGPPGTGKTSLIRALAEELDLPLHIFELAGMDNNEFWEAWNSSQSDKPRIVVFEDFDTVFHGRKNMIPQSTLELGVVLNAIDGLEREHGLLLFITTNKVEHIDPAVGKPIKGDPERSTRPRRIDMCIKMDGMDKPGRLKIANRILKGFPDVAAEMVSKYPDDGAALFEDKCTALAIEIRKNGLDKEIAA